MRVAVEFCLYRAYYVNFDSQAHVERDVFKDDIPFIYKNDFNSHAHVERDYSGFATGTNYQDFNSHAHVERDLFHVLPFSFHLHFNSHAHVERDNYKIELKKIMHISTHTLTWSVT